MAAGTNPRKAPFLPCLCNFNMLGSPLLWGTWACRLEKSKDVEIERGRGGAKRLSGEGLRIGVQGVAQVVVSCV
eukprot:409137-Amphidinium_carterae.1